MVVDMESEYEKVPEKIQRCCDDVTRAGMRGKDFVCERDRGTEQNNSIAIEDRMNGDINAATTEIALVFHVFALFRCFVFVVFHLRLQLFGWSSIYGQCKARGEDSNSSERNTIEIKMKFPKW